MMFGSGNIMRMLEGKKEDVISKFNYLKSSHIHSDILKLAKKAIPQRFFEDYPLDFLPINHPAYKELNDFNEPEVMEYLEECLNIDNPLIKVLKDFLKNNQ